MKEREKVYKKQSSSNFCRELLPPPYVPLSHFRRVQPGDLKCFSSTRVDYTYTTSTLQYLVLILI